VKTTEMTLVLATLDDVSIATMFFHILNFSRLVVVVVVVVVVANKFQLFPVSFEF